MPPGSATINVSLVSTTNVTVPGNVSALPIIDGTAVTVGEYVLLANQTTPSQNGIYYVDANAGLIPLPGMTAAAGVLNPNLSVFVTGGNNNSNTTWVPSSTPTNPIFVKG